MKWLSAEAKPASSGDFGCRQTLKISGMNNAETPTSIRDVEDGTLDLCSGESYRLVPGLNHITPVGFGCAPEGTVVFQDKPRFGRMLCKATYTFIVWQLDRCEVAFYSI